MSVDATGRQVEPTPETRKKYRARYLQLSRAAGVGPDDVTGVIGWLETQKRQWAASTLRQYRAAIGQAIADRAQKMSAAKHQRLVTRLKARPRTRKTGKPQTSARKRKSLPLAEAALLVETLNAGKHRDDRLVARIVKHNLRLFLRPIEWETAVIRGKHLIVQNAKATNGRSFGKERGRDLSNYGAAAVEDLRALLASLKTQAKAVGFVRLWQRLASRIARACKRAGIKRVSPYTTRHVGMSNAKTWMTPEEVAASAGHKTTATATSHYAKRRSSWGAKAKRVARPRPEDVEKVVSSPKASREKNQEYRYKRDAALKKEAARNKKEDEEDSGPTFTM
jgi:hypothetical protein